MTVLDDRAGNLERENAELRRRLAEREAELAEALDQQTATAEVLQVINSSPGDLAPVFEAMLGKAMDLCSATFGYLLTYDGERFQEVAHRGLPPKFAGYLPRMHQPGPSGAYARIKAGAPLVHIADLKEGEVYRTSPLRQALVDLGGARTGIIVALRKDKTLLGVLTMYRQEVRRFTDKQIALLQNFAAQAVIAMENARLLGELRQRTQELTRREIALRNSEERYELAMRAINEGVYEWDVATSEMYYSPRVCELVGLQASELRTMRDWTDLIHPDDRDAFKKAILAHFKGETDRLEAEYRYRHADGSWHWAWQHGIALKNRDGRAYRVVGSTGDITDRKVAEQALQEALEQQTATAEVLQVINTSPGDLAPVFGAMLEKALRLCGAAYGNLLSYDGECFQVLATTHDLPGLRFQTPSGTALDQILKGENVVSIDDLANSYTYRFGSPHFRRLVETGGYRSLLNVALRKDGALLGVIAVFDTQVRPFTDKQIALLQNFAVQAVIAMENARLINETREALEQQTATAEVLQVINSSPGDLTPVFDAMLERAMRLCEAEFGLLASFDGEAFHAAALRGVPRVFAESWREPRRPGPGLALHRLTQGENLVHIPDVTAEDAYRSGDPIRRALADLGGARTGVWVALRKDALLLGAFVIYRKEVRLFTDKQIALLQNFAAQAVIAMENARLLTETREALERQTATAEVLQVINSSPGDLTPVFDAILEKAHAVCDAALGGLLIYQGEEFRPIAIRAEPSFAEYWRQTPVQPPREGDAPYTQLIRGERIVHLPDVQASNAYRHVQVFRDFMDRGRIRTLLVIPLRKDNALLGAITAFRQEVRPFTDQQTALLQNFAQQAVIAIENGRLLDELRQRTNEVAELNRGLEARVAEQVEELARVGRLKRFLAPQLAELIVSQGDEKILESHRREIVVVFCDLRGYTAFTETAEPEEVLDFLREYHGALGPLVSQFEGTLDQFSGDGIMVFFNDPVPCPNPAERGVKMAMAMREAAGALVAEWRERGRDLGFGAGIAQGYATLGQIGFSERSGYTAIGTVCNVAARLCAEAKDGQILLSQRVKVALKGIVSTEQLGPLALKGLTQPIVAYNVPIAAMQPPLRVIEGGPQSA